METNVSGKEFSDIHQQAGGNASPLIAHSESPPCKACPYCAEPIMVAAVKCKHCGSDLSEAARIARSPTSPRLTIGRLFFTLVVCWMAIKALFGWAVVANEQMNPIIPAWNTLLTFGMIAIVIGLWRRMRWAHDWAVGTSVVTGINDLMTIPKVADSAVVLAFMAMGVAAACIAFFCLRGLDGEFMTHQSDDGAVPDLRDLRRGSTASIWISVALVVGSIAVSAIGNSK